MKYLILLLLFYKDSLKFFFKFFGVFYLTKINIYLIY